MAGRDFDLLRELRDRDQDRAIGDLREEMRLHIRDCTNRNRDLRRRLREIEQKLKPPGKPPNGLGLLSAISGKKLIIISIISIATFVSQDAQDLLTILSQAAKLLSSLK